MPDSPTASKEDSDGQPDFLRKSLAADHGAKMAKNHSLRAESTRQYYRSITTQDYAIGEIRKALMEAGVAENTVIVFTSDNGHFLGEHGFGGKWHMHEESIRVPCIIYDPRLPKTKRGKKREETVLNIDMAPTMLNMAGIPVPESMQGQSLMPLVAGKKPAWRNQWFYEHIYEHGGAIEPCTGIRNTRWKYIRYYKQRPEYEQLFDLQSDPGETKNLAGIKKYDNILRKFRKRELAYQLELK